MYLKILEMPKIDIEKRKLVVALHEKGFSQRKIANDLKIPRPSIQMIINKYRKYNTIENMPKSGRRKSYTDRELRTLIRLSKANPFFTARQLRAIWKPLSISSVKLLLRKNGLFGRISCKKPMLNKKQIQKRLDWAKSYGSWTTKMWSNVIFSDEASIQLKPSKIVYVRRCIGDRNKKPYTIKTVKHGWKSFMIWGAIKANGERILIRFLKNADSLEYQRVLNEGLFQIYNHSNIFQHDGAPPHRSASTVAYLNNRKVCYISDWPPQSPDVNIIENMWAELKRRLLLHNPKNLDELWDSCLSEWQKIPNEYIQKLYNSLPNRLLCIRKNKGENTNY